MMPTYPELIPAILQWAVDRDLLHPDGTANLATPEGQHDKTLEEIGEATEALEALQASRAKGRTAGYLACDVRDASLEFGDVLVTLTLQSAIQGLTLDQCLFAAGRLSTGWGSDWHLGKPSDSPCIWPYVEYHASMLGVAIEQDNEPDIAAYLGAVARCVEDAARIELSMLGPECLALALAKIAGRDGVFVKD